MESRSAYSKETPSRNSFQSGQNSHQSGSLVTAPLTTSAYKRIFSDKNRKSHLLPLFLQQRANGFGRSQVLPVVGNPIRANWVDSAPEEDKEVPHARLSSKDIERVKEIDKALNGAGSTHFSLVVGAKHIEHEHVVQFSEGQASAGVLIDAYMSTLKHSAQSVRVLVSSCAFAAQVFVEGREDISHTQANMLDYDILLFPLFDDYWKLLAIRMNKRHVFYFDPQRNHPQINKVLASLFRLFKNYLSQCQGEAIENTVWRDFYYQPRTAPGFQACDSAVYICKQASLFLSQRDETPDPFKVTAYKQDVLLALIDANR